MTFDHTLSGSDSSKSHLNLRVSTCFYHCSSYAKHGDSASLSVARVMWTYNGDVNSASGKIWKKLSSSTILTEASFNGDSNE